MLEMFELRTHLKEARQQLAASLYQHDAALRVITRVGRERDAAQAALDDLRGQLTAANARADAAATAAGGAGAAEGGAAKRPRTEVRLQTPAVIRFARLRESLTASNWLGR